MEAIQGIIFIKEREPGLLSISHDREKSLVSVLGGGRIIDYYIRPLLRAGFKRLTVFIDENMTGVREYLLYTYTSQELVIKSNNDVYGAFLDVLRSRSYESILILRADGMLLPDWEDVRESLLDLPEGDYEVRSEQKERIGYFLHKTRFMDRFEKERYDHDPEESAIDRTWELIPQVLRPVLRVIEYKIPFYRLETVVDYYVFHLSMLENIEPCLQLCSLLPAARLNEEDRAEIGGTGFVKDSYISHSCVIDGYVEHSFLFSHVKIGQNAQVIDSIIMDSNYIGDDAVIRNSIVCSGNELFSRVLPNIGEGALIGEDEPTGANEQYPRFLYKGITLIGQNVEIPRKFRISRNCYIASNINKGMLKSRGRVKAGDSVLGV